MDETPITNRFPGRCTECGSQVAAGAGLYDRNPYTRGVRHLDGQHNTATKTWRATQARIAGERFRAAVAALYTDAGYARQASERIEAPTVITGHGLTATVGGYRRGEVFARGLEVRRDGILIHDGPEPRVTETGDYYADHLAAQRQIVETLNGLANVAK